LVRSVVIQTCAVLFGIPVNREEFDFKAEPGSGSDYLTGMLRGDDPGSVWASEYESVAVAAQQLVDTAHRLGVHTYMGATLKDFSEATAHAQCVVLFAHWRGAMFKSSDLVGDVDAILERMEQQPTLRKAKPRRHERDAIVDALNAAIEGLALLETLPKLLAEAGRRTKAIGQTLCRDVIDEVLSGLGAPGNRVELFDGLHTLGDMDHALCREFSGELDMALCNSEAWATFVDIRRGDKVRHLHWPFVLHPLPQLLKVEKTLELMAVNSTHYIETRLGLEETE
jgi:hypothetical protein